MSTYVASGYSDPSADLYEDVDPSPLTAEESERVPQIATEAYQTLYSQDNRSMFLGDFIAELREMNVRTAIIDEVLEWMTTNGWVNMWRRTSTGETWITALPGDEESGEGEEDTSDEEEE